jgi:hypothetical protein
LISGRFQSRAPGGMELIGDREVNTSLGENVIACGHDGRRVLGRRETIDERSNPHIAKVLVILHLRIKENCPTDILSVLLNDESKIPGVFYGVERTECRRAPVTKQGIGAGVRCEEIVCDAVEV